MMDNENKRIGYQFTPMPKQLMHLLDVNCRSMLFALIDDSEYFASSDGWFYRTNSDLQNDSKLSKNLVTATIDTLYHYGIVEVMCDGKQPNNYRVCTELFKFFEQLNMGSDINRPQNRVETVKYKGSGYSPSYLKDNPLRVKPTLKDGIITWIPISDTNTSTTSDTIDVTKEVTKSDNNIEYIDNIEYVNNKENINNIDYKENKEYIDNKNNIECNNNLLEENFEMNSIESKELKEEETFVRLCEEANSDESQPKDGIKENLNKHQLIENKALSPKDNKKINKILKDIQVFNQYPRLYGVQPMDADTYDVLNTSLENLAISTNEQYKSNFEVIYRQFNQIRESHTKEQMKHYFGALCDISTILGKAYSATNA